MATQELISNVKKITSGAVPTTSTLKDGEFAFGEVGGVPKIYGNVGGKIMTFVPDFGTTAGTICEGNDSRLSNARTPTAHSSTTTTYGSASQTNYGHVKQTMPLYTSRPSSVTTDTGTSFGQRSRTVMHCGNVTGVTINLNNYRCEGDYIFYNCTARSNFPSDLSKANTTNPSAHLMVLEHGYSDTTITQMLFMRGKANSTNLCAWIRQCNGSTSYWSAWTELGGGGSSGGGLTVETFYGVTGSGTTSFTLPYTADLKKIEMFVDNTRASALITGFKVQVGTNMAKTINLNVDAPLASIKLSFMNDVGNANGVAYVQHEASTTYVKASSSFSGNVTITPQFESGLSIDAIVHWRAYK